MKRWMWKELESRERGRPTWATSGWKRPEHRINSRGMIVKAIRLKDRRPALERFFEKLEYLGECWLYRGGNQIWVNDDIIISPWRFSFEVHHGVLVAPHARFGWTCETAGCCNWEHLYVKG